MKNKLIQHLFATVSFVAFLVGTAGTAFAVANDRAVISPYWQSDSDVYTFVAVTHPSLSGSNSEIGVVLNVLQENGTTVFGTTSFTVTNAKTTRVLSLQQTTVPLTAQILLDRMPFLLPALRPPRRVASPLSRDRPIR